MTFDTPEIGLGRGLSYRPTFGNGARTCRQGQLTPLEWEDCWTEDTPLDYNVLVYPKFLRNLVTLANTNRERDFGYWTVKTPQEAYRLLRKLTREGLLR